MMGQMYYLAKDEEISKLVAEDPSLKALTPTLSHLLRTSNLDKDTIKEMKIRWRMACRLQILIGRNPDLGSYSKYQSWVNFGYAAIEDTKEGWRGRLLTERIKIMKVEMGQPRRRKLLGIF
jgi:hypothetical protein